MIAFRTCRRCGEQFDAIVGTDNNVLCEACRGLVALVDDMVKEEIEQSLFDSHEILHQEICPIPEEDVLLMAGVKHNLNKGNIKGDVPGPDAMRHSHSKVSTKAGKPPKVKRVGGFVVMEGETDTLPVIDDDLMRMLDSISLD